MIASDVAIAGGGPAATAAVTLARLGVATAFVGAVGDDETGAFIRDGLESEGVDVSELAVVPGRGRRRARSTSARARGRSLRSAATWGRLELSQRAEQLCRDAAWVHVDQTGYGTASRATSGSRSTPATRSRAST